MNADFEVCKHSAFSIKLVELRLLKYALGATFSQAVLLFYSTLCVLCLHENSNCSIVMYNASISLKSTCQIRLISIIVFSTRIIIIHFSIRNLVTSMNIPTYVNDKYMYKRYILC